MDKLATWKFNRWMRQRARQERRIQKIIIQKAAANLNLTNKERAQRAEVALAAYPGREEADLAASIVDLVVDLMHLAHFNNIEPDYVAQMSADHYTAEVEEFS